MNDELAALLNTGGDTGPGSGAGAGAAGPQAGGSGGIGVVGGGSASGGMLPMCTSQATTTPQGFCSGGAMPVGGSWPGAACTSMQAGTGAGLQPDQLQQQQLQQQLLLQQQQQHVMAMQQQWAAAQQAGMQQPMAPLPWGAMHAMMPWGAWSWPWATMMPGMAGMQAMHGAWPAAMGMGMTGPHTTPHLPNPHMHPGSIAAAPSAAGAAVVGLHPPSQPPPAPMHWPPSPCGDAAAVGRTSDSAGAGASAATPTHINAYPGGP